MESRQLHNIVFFTPGRSPVDNICNESDLERLEKFSRDKITLDK